MDELFRILCGQYQPTQLYLRAGFSSLAQASFFLISMIDSVGTGYCQRLMSRPDDETLKVKTDGNSE